MSQNNDDAAGAAADSAADQVFDVFFFLVGGWFPLFLFSSCSWFLFPLVFAVVQAVRVSVFQPVCAFFNPCVHATYSLKFLRANSWSEKKAILE